MKSSIGEGGGNMARTWSPAGEIVGQLRAIEIELGKGLAVVEANDRSAKVTTHVRGRKTR